MAAELNTDAELISYAEASGLGTIDAGAMTTANATATDMIRQAALNDYTSASFELLTSATTPPEMKQKHAYLTIGAYSDGHANRPQSIDDRWAEGNKYLGLLVAGRTHYDKSAGAVLVKSGTGGSRVVHHGRTRAFGRAEEGETLTTFDLWDTPL